MTVLNITRLVNPSTRVLEYTIQELSGNGINEATRDFDIYNDLAILYTNVLMNYPEMESVVLASRTVLDGKYFAKEWPLKYENDQSLRLIC